MSQAGNYEKKFDIVVIGAGVIGCSIAYHLAKESGGKLKVGVIERNNVCAETSGGSAGMTAAQIEADGAGPFLELALASRKMFAPLANELKETAGVDIEYLQSGILEAAFQPERERKLKDRLARQKQAGLECEWWDAAAIRQKFPFFTKPALGGLWAPGDGQVSANRLTLGFAEAAKRLGVEIYEFESFEEIRLSKPRLDFVETNISKFSAGKFVFATGPWTGKLLGAAAPVEPVKGQILIFELPENLKKPGAWESPVYIGDTPGESPIHCYFVPKRDGHLLLGATMDRKGFDRSENPQAAERMTRYACEIFPGLENFPFKGSWVGLRPGPPDGLPILGALPGFENVFVAGGHLRNGILLGPVTGKLLAELLIHGKPSLSLDPFSPARFA